MRDDERMRNRNSCRDIPCAIKLLASKVIRLLITRLIVRQLSFKLKHVLTDKNYDRLRRKATKAYR